MVSECSIQLIPKTIDSVRCRWSQVKGSFRLKSTVLLVCSKVLTTTGCAVTKKWSCHTCPYKGSTHHPFLSHLTCLNLNHALFMKQCLFEGYIHTWNCFNGDRLYRDLLLVIKLFTSIAQLNLINSYDLVIMSQEDYFTGLAEHRPSLIPPLFTL